MEFFVDLPIHMRYQKPSSIATYQQVIIPSPLIYLCCNSSGLWTRLPLEASNEDIRLSGQLWVPVGEQQRQGLVTAVTLLATTLGSLIVLFFLSRKCYGNKEKLE